MNSDTKIDTKATNLDIHHKSRDVDTSFQMFVPGCSGICVWNSNDRTCDRYYARMLSYRLTCSCDEISRQRVGHTNDEVDKINDSCHRSSQSRSLFSYLSPRPHRFLSDRRRAGRRLFLFLHIRSHRRLVWVLPKLQRCCCGLFICRTNGQSRKGGEHGNRSSVFSRHEKQQPTSCHFL